MTRIAESFPAILVTGARQAGKSTLLENFIKNHARRDGKACNRVTLDDIDKMQKANSDSRLFLMDHKPPVIVDEMQYAPNLFRYSPFLPDESNACHSRNIADADGICERIFLGSFPMLHGKDEITRDLCFSSYAQSYLNRDAKDITSIKNIMAFNNFLKATAARTECLLNCNDPARLRH